MMKHLYIIGDSQARAFFTQSFEEQISFIDFKINNIPVHLRSFKQMTAYKVDEDFLSTLSFEPGSVVLFYFGFVDIRSFLCQYDNAQDVSNNYVSRVNKYFMDKDIKVGFIEPIPSVNTDIWLSINPDLGSWVNGSAEERKNQHEKFLDLIKKQDIFIPVVGTFIDSYFLDYSQTRDGSHLTPELNSNLMLYIFDKIKGELI